MTEQQDDYTQAELDAFDAAVTTVRFLSRRATRKGLDSAIVLAATMGVIQAAIQINGPKWAQACFGTENWEGMTLDQITKQINAKMNEVRQRSFNTAISDYQEHPPVKR